MWAVVVHPGPDNPLHFLTKAARIITLAPLSVEGVEGTSELFPPVSPQTRAGRISLFGWSQGGL